jgi:hypothetical protein
MRLTARTPLLTFWVLAAACGSPDPPEAGVGTPVRVTGTVDTLATTASELLAAPADLHRLPDGRLLVSDEMAHVIQVFDRDGSHLATLGGEGQGPGEFNRPGSLGSRGDTILVVDVLNGRIQFLSDTGGPLAALPLHAGPPPVLAPHGRVIHPTFGIDSVMAVVRELEGVEVARLGTPPAPVTRVIRLSEVKAEIEAGEVPELFLNTALPVGDADGAVWLYTPALARVERHPLEGAPKGFIELEDPGFSGEREWFMERNRGAQANQLLPLELIRSARVVGDRLWVLLGTGPDGPARIAILSPDPQEVARLQFEAIRGAGDFLVDPTAGEAFFTIPERAELIRVRVDSFPEVP